MAPPLLLYYFIRSMPSRAVLLTIRQLNLNVELKEINLAKKDQLSPDYLKINPQHTVPTINDNGFILWESRAITTYLVDTKFPGHELYPKEFKKRARINQMLYFDATTLSPRIRNICYPLMALGETTISTEKKNELYKAFSLMDGFLENSKWFAGNDITLADLSILSSLTSIIEVGASIQNYPRIVDWFERCKNLPGFDENLKGAKIFAETCHKNLAEKF